MHYFDYASTSPTDEGIVQKYTNSLSKYFANSESSHPLGIQANNLLDASRTKTASLLGVDKKEILFLSGACEANSLAIKGYALKNKNKGNHCITTKIEHSSVINSFKQLEKFGFEVTYLDVDEKGIIDLNQLKNSLRKDTILVSIMAVNNEVGSIQPIDKVIEILKDYPKTKLHVDAVQAIGKVPFRVKGIDMASFTMHKIHGLKGSAVLYKKNNIELLPLISGGDQEFGYRGGSEPYLTYALIGDTLELALKNEKEHYQKVKALSDYIYQELSIPSIKWNSNSAYILNFSCMGLPSEVHLNALANQGFCVSAKSTCNTNLNVYSHVLAAMGLNVERQKCAIRISLDADNTLEECKLLCDAIKENIEKYGIK